jgi:hypothetical protein
MKYNLYRCLHCDISFAVLDGPKDPEPTPEPTPPNPYLDPPTSWLDMARHHPLATATPTPRFTKKKTTKKKTVKKKIKKGHKIGGYIGNRKLQI